MSYRFVVVLVHSPIVGPDTWWPVAEALREGGYEVVVPVLGDDGSVPFWRQHVRAVSATIEGTVHRSARTVLVAHSGAGQLLGMIGEAAKETGRSVAAYLFVDAGLPTMGQSRLGQLEAEAPDFAAVLRELFDTGGRFPNWSEELLTGLVPDEQRRRRLMDGIRHLPREYWEEEIPASVAWPDAPCGALLFTDAYERAAQAAIQQGWPLRRLPSGNHFFMLADPPEVTNALTALIDATVRTPTPEPEQ